MNHFVHLVNFGEHAIGKAAAEPILILCVVESKLELSRIHVTRQSLIRSGEALFWEQQKKEPVSMVMKATTSIPRYHVWRSNLQVQRHLDRCHGPS